MLTSLLFDRILWKTGTAKVLFLNRRCLRSRFNRSECRSCLDECQTGALKLDGRKVVFTQEKCTACMRCVSACPNDAFDGGLDLRHLLETISCSSQIVLTCRKNANFQQKLTVPCIGSLSEPLLAVMNCVAMDKIIVDLSQCPDCINQHCLSSFQVEIGKLSDRLKANGRIPLKYSIEKNSAHPGDEKLARRSYLGMAKESLIDLGRESIGAGKTDTNTNSSHTRAEKGPAMDSVALQYAYKHSSEENKHLLLSFFYTVSVTEQCNLCPGCQGMCPTGALKRTELNGEKRLMFTSSACNGCGLCREFCKKTAVEVVRGAIGDPEKPRCIC